MSVPKPPNRDRELLAAHERRKMELRLNGTSLAALSRDLGVSKTTLSWVSLRKLSVPRVEQAIAEAIGRPVDEVFPDHRKKGGSSMSP